MAQADVIDQNADIQSISQLLQAVVVGVLVQCKVHCQCLDRDLGAVFRGYVCAEGVELGLGARHENEVVALGGKGESELLANAVGCTSDEGPGTTGSVGGELVAVSIRLEVKDVIIRTGLPGSTNKLSRTLIVLMMGAANAAMPASKKPYTAAWTRLLLASMRTPNVFEMLDMVNKGRRRKERVQALVYPQRMEAQNEGPNFWRCDACVVADREPIG